MSRQVESGFNHGWIIAKAASGVYSQNAPAALGLLFEGKNHGKLMIKVT